MLIFKKMFENKCIYFTDETLDNQLKHFWIDFFNLLFGFTEAVSFLKYFVKHYLYKLTFYPHKTKKHGFTY